MKNILVTGSNGYLGGKFISTHASCYTFKTFSLLNQKIKNIDFYGIDTVLHCAALVHKAKGVSVNSYWEVNAIYPAELAAMAKKNGVKQFIFISSIAVHGELVNYVDENTICNPTTPYGKSKLEAENLLLAMSDEGFKVSIVRLPMIYGEGAPGNIDSILRLAKACPLLPLGNINNKRTFISIQNTCHALREVIEQRKGGIFLFSDDGSVSTSRLVRLLAKKSGRRVYLFEWPFFKYVLKKLNPSVYNKIFGSLVVNSSSSQKKLSLKNPLTVGDAFRIRKSF